MKARLPKGLGGGPQSMDAMLRQAKKLQEDAEAKEAELAEREYEISAGGGMVKVIIAGTMEIKSIKIAEEIVDPDDIETLEDIVTAAANEAIKRVMDTKEEEMAKITGSLNIPGMF